MKAFSRLGLAAAALAFGTGAFAQDHSGHDMGAAAATGLPQACQVSGAPEMPGMEEMHSAMTSMGEHQKAFMAGMMETEPAMMRGMMAEDPDIAFACAMIPHHQGAINMAEVELQHGDSDAMKELARKIIDAQKAEIEQLTQWIESEAQ